ncbi:MAG: 23S rRNA (guanosine-2'-O-)-methyltransferase RlmB [Herbaspirillum frisingense]|uniref:23S rRNA (Guanosine-2'-O-)-methyltransferase RlmB n=1 Tax=Herbaspirillum frisingense TaxID=92645 RepID=A0A7V8FZI0_9BURK|nr:MAG: 23S rRNA (guanosine-2'-O-)-methyltransferase RlmB [Herbaspirillum frisingense]
MKLITSKDNPLFKDLKQLAASSQARRRAGQTLLDGVHLAQAWLQHRGAPQMCVVAESAQYHPEVAPILAQCEQGRAQCLVLSDNLYGAVSQVENGVGLLLLVATPAPRQPQELTQSAVLLDGLQDPGNLGSILRSAAAAGIRQVFCSSGTAAAWSPKVLRAGMGAHFVLDIFEGADLAPLCMSSQIPVLATSSHAAQTIYDCDLSGNVAWLFGHEGQGVSPQLQEAASHEVVIPHLGEMESLNVAAAAAVCFFEQVRQRTVGR